MASARRHAGRAARHELTSYKSACGVEAEAVGGRRGVSVTFGPARVTLGVKFSCDIMYMVGDNN